MKLYKLVNVLGALNDTGKLACDMYELGKQHYYSNAHQQDIPISEMDFQHLVRAFIKQSAEVKYYKKLAEDNFKSSVDESETSDDWKKKYDALRETYAILFDNCDLKDKHIERLSLKMNEWKEKYQKEVDNAEFWKKTYYESVDVKGKVYVFSDIPNDCDGQRFTDDLKKYLNKESYKMRIRGQYLKDEVKETEGWKKYERGQPISHSKCLRVYIDTN